MQAKHLESPWYVYLARCRDGSLYTGIAKSPQKRIAEHNTDNQLGAKYTRARRPVSLVYEECFISRSQAARRESAIKRLPKIQKEQLVRAGKHPRQDSEPGRNSTKRIKKAGSRPQKQCNE
ncbi:MAG TPA: GIY-YIG nuclease family protein [Gammaproteobacteria bacterium]